MTIEPEPQPAPRGQPADAGEHLAAIAASLSGQGVPARLTRLGGIPVLTIDQPGGGPDRAAVTIDPAPGPGPQVECTCIWTPALGATPQATAGTVIAVLAALGQDTPAPRPAVARTGPGQETRGPGAAGKAIKAERAPVRAPGTPLPATPPGARPPGITAPRCAPEEPVTPVPPPHPLPALTTYELARYRRDLEHALTSLPAGAPARQVLGHRLDDVLAEQRSRDGDAVRAPGGGLPR